MSRESCPIDAAAIPPAIRSLPTWGRYPIPWFVTVRVGDRPDFRVVDPRRVFEALTRKLCWICGGPMRPRQVAFVVGPMCTVNRVSADPPAHPECGEYAARSCPFLAEPDRTRRPGGVADLAERDGGMIERNPGVAAPWTCARFSVEPGLDNRKLMRMGEPTRVRWFREGRGATRDEVAAAFDSGCPIPQRMAEEDGPDAVALLGRMRADALRFWPAPTTVASAEAGR